MSTEIDASFPIQCQHLLYHYGSKQILSNVKLNIPRGAVVGLIGTNGCGKSTLLRCLAGLLAPQEGFASLLGTPSLALNDAVRERLGYVAQTPDLFPWLTVEKHLYAIGQAYPRWTERRAIELAIQLRLPMGRQVSQLSGGDQQKLAVVLAMAHQPEVLILDEPVSSLDPMTRRDFMRTLFQGERPIYASEDDEEHDCAMPTILISSHLLHDLERVVSHVAFMRNGEIQLFDTWDAVLEFVRIVPKTVKEIPPHSCIAESKDHRVMDLRLLDAESQNLARNNPEFKPHSLDDLFIALNS